MFYQFFEVAAVFGDFFEGVEVADHKIDGGNAESPGIIKILPDMAPVQNGAFDLKADGLHSAAEGLGAPGNFLYGCELQPFFSEEPRRAARGDNFHILLTQKGRELSNSGFIADTQYCSFHGLLPA